MVGKGITVRSRLLKIHRSTRVTARTRRCGAPGRMIGVDHP